MTHQLRHPEGDLAVAWTFDAHRYQHDDPYRSRVDAFLAAHRVTNPRPATMRVLDDESGQRVVVVEAWTDPDGAFYRDSTGRVAPTLAVVPLDPSETLP
ncbi:hypothetical protein FE697_006700 [Mumia zhuanghuii]|uniref:Antibiotic biosynthesis monooxygenase n=2 Tax=Mumia TaxID=1546255 RepID=A0ABW1QMW2_9ACTN|nr:MULTISPECIES: hypothetical protein [Mumia]KAA1423305.1 hypothetical protein FE697_006700 [Mumia zhuanghuii]